MPRPAVGERPLNKGAFMVAPTPRPSPRYNLVSLVMPFLGAAYLVVCAHAVEHPSTRSVVTVALVGAILANVHFAGITCSFGFQTCTYDGSFRKYQRHGLSLHV